MVRMTLRGSAVVLLMLAGCMTGGSRAEEPPAEAAVVSEAMIDVAENPHLDEALALMNEHCGSCHIPASPDAKPGALAVFALDDPHWYTRLTEEQLESAYGRFADKTDEAGLITMRAFFDAELGFRGRAPK